MAGTLGQQPIRIPPDSILGLTLRDAAGAGEADVAAGARDDRPESVGSRASVLVTRFLVPTGSYPHRNPARDAREVIWLTPGL